MQGGEIMGCCLEQGRRAVIPAPGIAPLSSSGPFLVRAGGVGYCDQPTMVPRVGRIIGCLLILGLHYPFCPPLLSLVVSRPKRASRAFHLPKAVGKPGSTLTLTLTLRLDLETWTWTVELLGRPDRG